MHPMNDFLSGKTRKQHKKHMPKRKVSELDEIEAKRRRDQASRAQRAFRQRKEDTIAHLNLRIASLDKTVEDLNSCFLTLTDELVASKWLQHDPKVTEAVQKSIERFLFIVQTSDVQHGANGDPTTCHNLTPVTIKPPVLEFHSNSSHESSHCSLKTIVAEPVSTTSIWRTDDQLPHSQNAPCEFSQSRTDTINLLPRLPMQGPMILVIPTFAQRLHMEALWCGLRLVHAAESHSKQFYQVFNQVPDFYTRERLKTILGNIFNVGGNQLLTAPPESDFNVLWEEDLSCAWLNASDVARYFRIIGMDFDGSQGIATFKHYPSTLARKPIDAQDSGVPNHSSLHHDDFLELDHRYRLQGAAAHSNPPILSCDATTQDLGDFGMSIGDCSYANRNYGQQCISIDVSRLIQEIVLSTRCQYSYPVFSRDVLDHALANAALKARCP